MFFSLQESDLNGRELESCDGLIQYTWDWALFCWIFLNIWYAIPLCLPIRTGTQTHISAPTKPFPWRNWARHPELQMQSLVAYCWGQHWQGLFNMFEAGAVVYWFVCHLWIFFCKSVLEIVSRGHALCIATWQLASNRVNSIAFFHGETPVWSGLVP